MGRKSTQKLDRGIFRARFEPLYQEGKKAKKWNSEEDFGKKLSPVASRSTVANWRKKEGSAIPEPKRLKNLCDVFGVPSNYFDPSTATRDELYKYASPYMTEIVKEEAVPYCERIGLDLFFLNGIRSIMGDQFDLTFPIWTPITRNPQLFSEDNYIRSRTTLSPSAQTEPDQSVFQCNVPETFEEGSDRRRVTLSRADLDFLRDVQEEVNDYIEFLFLKRLKGQEEEIHEVNRRSWIQQKDGGLKFDPLKADDLNQIDKYFHGYTDKKPEDTEVRDATQEDCDRFRDGEKTVTDKNGLIVEIKEGE